jgi:hypothetical protein
LCNGNRGSFDRVGLELRIGVTSVPALVEGCSRSKSCNSGPVAWRAVKFIAWVAIVETRTMRLGRGEVGEGRGEISDDGSS